MATKAEVAKQIKAWDDPFIECRDVGHAWALQAVIDERKYTGEVVRELVCPGCTTERIDRVGYKTGEIYARRYRYPKGYAAPKGQFARGDLKKAEIRAEAMRRLVNGRK